MKIRRKIPDITPEEEKETKEYDWSDDGDSAKEENHAYDDWDLMEDKNEPHLISYRRIKRIISKAKSKYLKRVI